MMTCRLSEVFTLPSIRWQLFEESETPSGLVDGVYILGRAVGPFFLIDGESRNKKYYSKLLWENAISRNKESLDNRSMLGTIGHDGKLDDEALREGKVSHIVTRLWIDEENKIGMGEILILSTPAGVNLNALLRGGVPLAVSSRASGEINGKTKTGGEIVNPETYILEGFDFVRTPGVLSAFPKLVESLTSEISESSKKPEVNMSLEKLVESLSSEKVTLTERLDEALESSRQAKVKLTAAEQSVTLKVGEVTALSESLSDQKRLNEDLTAKIKAYEALGTADQISENLKNSMSLLEAYKELGSTEEITEALNKSHAVISEYADLGTPEKIGLVFDIVEEYQSLGNPSTISEGLERLSLYEDLASPAEVNKLIDLVESYSDLATPAEVTRVLELTETYAELATPHQVDRLIQVVEAYSALGTPEQIDRALTRATMFFEAAKDKSNTKLVESFAKKFDLDPATATEMVEKFGSTESASEFLTKLKTTTDVRTRYRVPTDEGVKAPVNENFTSVLERNTESRASSLMKPFIR